MNGVKDEPAYEVQIEPWGEMFDIGPGTSIVVTFLGPSNQPDPAKTCVSQASWGISLWALDGCSDYQVTDRSGEPVVGH